MVPIALSVLTSVCMLQSGTLPPLAPAVAVDIRIKSMDWHPAGRELIYSRDEEKGIGVGLYKVGAPEGKVLLHLAKEDSWSSQWFEGSNCALTTVYHTAQGHKTGTIYLLDGDKQAVTRIFARTVTDKQALSIGLNLSPSLTHAILDVTEDTKHYFAALTLGSNEAVAAPDIDEAYKEGFGGPAWSKDGTAIYAKGLPISSNISLNIETAYPGNNDLSLRIGDGTASTNTDVTTSLFNALIRLTTDSESKYLLLPRIKAPDAGTPVLELLPSNATMRQVRSPGPWEDVPATEPTIEKLDHMVSIVYGPSSGSTNSIWLAPATKQQPDAKRVVRPRIETEGGELVAAHADSAELSPTERAIAYIIDGALFVREIKGSRK